MKQETTLTGEILAGEEHAAAIKKLLGPEVMIEVVNSMDRAIPRPLHLSQSPGEVIEIRQPEIVGVRCGAASNGLVAAGFRTPEALQTFVDANTSIRTCPVTKWNGILLTWLRTDFLADQNHELEEILFLSNAVVPLCWLDDDANIEVVRSGKPATVSYNDIVWPQVASGVFRYSFLKSVYGTFFTKTKRKKSLNLSLWAAWLGDCLQLRFDARIGSFRHTPRPGETGEVLARSTVKELVLAALQDSARLEPQHFPVAEIRPRRVEELLALMEVMTALPSPISDAAGLEEFLRIRIVSNQEADVTCEELWSAYQTHCRVRGCVSYTQHEFYPLLPSRIRERFGRTLSHSIMRGGARRGYRGISLVIDDAADVGQMPGSINRSVPQSGNEKPNESVVPDPSTV